MIYCSAWGEKYIQVGNGWCVVEDSFGKIWRDTEEWHCWYVWFFYLQWSKTRQRGERQTPVESEWKQFCNCLTNWVGPEWINCSYRIPEISSTFLTEIFIYIHGLFMLGGAPGSHTQIFQKEAMKRYKFSFLSLDWRVMLDKSETWAPEDWKPKCWWIFCLIQSGSQR